jgi:hypothetical protein
MKTPQKYMAGGPFRKGLLHEPANPLETHAARGLAELDATTGAEGRSGSSEPVGAHGLLAL